MPDLPESLSDSKFDEEFVRKNSPLGIEEEEKFLWCLHCQRVYRVGRHRLVNGLIYCPFSGCNGTIMDGWEQSQHLLPHGFLPLEVEEGEFYDPYRPPGFEFEFVEVPKELLPVVGTQQAGTRIYEQSGPQNHSSEWFAALCDAFGDLVSPGGVCMFAPVSRAAVHKRLKEGRLTAFYYQPEETSNGLFGSKKKSRQTAYCYIPASEARSWRLEIADRLERKGDISAEEIEGEPPSWRPAFLKWKRKAKSDESESS